MTARRLAMVTALVVGAALTPAVDAYLRLGFQVGNQVIGIKWTTQPIRYAITNRDVPGVTAQQLQTAAARAFAEWGGPDLVAVDSQFLGFTGADPFVDDGQTVIGFRPRPDLDRTLGAATFEINSQTGAILESDIFLNTIFQWSVAENGEANRFDVESILVHEIGHLLGLGHSALGETEQIFGGRSVLAKAAVMFPIAYARGSVADRAIRPDDVAGIREIYGTPEADRRLGAIAGRVTLNGQGVFGAHVTAFNPATGDLVSGFSLSTNGSFVIAGLEPGLYIVRAEPLDDADVDSFFDESPTVNINFQVTYFNRQVAVPAGGSSGSIEIRVRAK